MLMHRRNECISVLEHCSFGALVVSGRPSRHRSVEAGARRNSWGECYAQTPPPPDANARAAILGRMSQIQCRLEHGESEQEFSSPSPAEPKPPVPPL